jgi:hypothetical protein
MNIELKASGFGINVDKRKAEKEFPLRGLNLPLESGLNNEKSIENYSKITENYTKMYKKATDHWRNE